jgi:DNA-binding transcriptional LysR family regulator
MELYQIRYFLAVCDTLNFTRAAEGCHVSQPSLTRAVKKLEDELGGELFRRERSRTHLTELGRAMQPFLKQSLDSALAAKEQAETYGRGETAPLHLGISSTIEIRVLLPALRELARALPGLKLHLVRMPAKEAMQQLEGGEIELCVTAIDEISWDRIDRWPLFTEDFVLFAGATHPLGNKSAVALSDLKDQKLINRPHCEHAGILSDLLKEQQVPTGGCHELSDQSDLGASVGEGLGVGIAPRSTQTPESVIAVPIKEPALQRTVSLLAVSGRRYSPAASGLIRLLRAADWSHHALA